MSQDELAVMDGGKCILQLRGVRPFLSDKYDITKHPNYPYTADADPKNAFDIEGVPVPRLKLKPNEVYDVYEVDAEGGKICSAVKGDLVYPPQPGTWMGPSAYKWKVTVTTAKCKVPGYEAAYGLWQCQVMACPRTSALRFVRLIKSNNDLTN